MEKKGGVQTTIGLHTIVPSDQVLIHEHVFNRFPFRLQTKMENYVLKELIKIYQQGITIVCDLTAYTKPYNYYKIIEQSPVKIVCCLGFYTPRYVPAQQKKQSYDALLKSFSKSIENGIGVRKIKPGILKIAAQTSKLSATEEKQFSVVAALSADYGLPIAVHAPDGALDHVRYLIAAGAKPEKIFVAHIEKGIASKMEYNNRLIEAKQILSLGAFVQLSDFGCSPNSKKCSAGISFISDLINEGFLQNLLISADSCWRWKNGNFVVKDYNLGDGKHYTYTKDFSLPLIEQAISDVNIEQVLLRDNPARLLSI